MDKDKMKRKRKIEKISEFKNDLKRVFEKHGIKIDNYWENDMGVGMHKLEICIDREIWIHEGFEDILEEINVII